MIGSRHGPDASGRITLQNALERALTRVTLLAVTAAGLTVLITGLLVMRSYARHDLALVAAYSSYSVAPAVAFNDPTAAADAIRPIATAGGVAEMIVMRADASIIARWRRPGGSGPDVIDRLIYPDPVVVPIGPADRPIGRLSIAGNAESLIRFLIAGVVGGFFHLLITAIGTRVIARRLRHTIVTPLQAIAQVAHAVRAERNFERRAPHSTITEVDDLGQDFNALLDELQDWHGQLHSAHEALIHKASHDPLSGLPNRSSFIERVRDAIKQSQRSGDRFAILFMDGNRFKETNDRHGHAAGDRVITEVAARLGPLLRVGDLAARLGGDEFAVLIHHLDDTEDAGRVARRITDAMTAPIAINDTDSVTISLSIGVAIYPDHGGDVDALIHHADADMYAHKQQGRV